MGISVEWDNDEQTTLRYTVLGAWTWEEFYAARDAGRNLADAVAQAQLNAIIDLQAASLFPANALSHLRSLSGDSHPKFKFGVVVIVENHLFVRSLMTMMRHLNPTAMQPFSRARTLTEARALLPAPLAVHP